MATNQTMICGSKRANHLDAVIHTCATYASCVNELHGLLCTKIIMVHAACVACSCDATQVR